MNPRQRRGLFMIAVAVVGAAVVFFAVLSYVGNVESEVGDKVVAFEITRNVGQYQPIPASAVKKVEMPQRWLPDTAVRSLDDLTGTVAAAPLTQGTLLQESAVVPAPRIGSGTRAVTILVDAETGVAGKITPGATVDVWATFDKDTTGTGPRTKLVAQRVLVLDVGMQTQRNTQTSTGVVEPSEAIPVTFAANTEEIKALTYAESFAVEVRLALRAPADGSAIPPGARSYAESFPPRGGN